MAKINFVIDGKVVEKMPEEDWEAIERAQDGDVKLYLLRPFFSKFLVDEQGKSIPYAQAFKMLGKVPLDDWKDIIQSFTDALQNASVPKANGNSLKPPSDQNMPSSESPAG